MTRPTLLHRDFFLRSPEVVARELLGKLLVRQYGAETLLARVTETEAYFGSDDPAAHSAAGRTKRTEVLFGPPGHAYVYLIYGKHFCLNVSCEPEGQAGCVLLRAAEPLMGLEAMRQLRRLPETTKTGILTVGPGRLCEALGITRASINGMDLTKSESPLQLSEDGHRPASVLATPRIGIRRATDRLARFCSDGDSFVSGPRTMVRRSSGIVS